MYGFSPRRIAASSISTPGWPFSIIILRSVVASLPSSASFILFTNCTEKGLGRGRTQKGCQLRFSSKSDEGYGKLECELDNFADAGVGQKGN